MSHKVTSSPAKKVAGKKNPQAALKRPAPSAMAVSQGALADPADLTPEKILALQRAAGNQAVQRLLAQRAPKEEKMQAKVASTIISRASASHEIITSSRRDGRGAAKDNRSSGSNCSGSKVDSGTPISTSAG